MVQAIEIIDALIVDYSRDENPQHPEPSNPLPPIGQHGSVPIFAFSKPSNGQPYPPDQAGNGYVNCHFPSHAIISLPVHEYREGMLAKVEYKLINDKEETVLHVRDEVGGFHPNYFNDPKAGILQTFQQWCASFKPDGAFNSPQDKGNNHFPEFQGFLPVGPYRWQVKNLGTVALQLYAGKIRETNGKGQIDGIPVAPGGQAEVVVFIGTGNLPDSKFDPFKFNVNAYHS